MTRKPGRSDRRDGSGQTAAPAIPPATVAAMYDPMRMSALFIFLQNRCESPFGSISDDMVVFGKSSTFLAQMEIEMICVALPKQLCGGRTNKAQTEFPEIEAIAFPQYVLIRIPLPAEYLKAYRILA
jgi:hypothetical protein